MPNIGIELEKSKTSNNNILVKGLFKDKINLDKNSKEISLKKRIFKTISFKKDPHAHSMNFQVPKTKKNLYESGTNNMGLLLDLDDAVALSKINTGGAERTAISKVNPIPSSGLEMVSVTLGSYLTIAGMYFGHVNYKEGNHRVNKLKPIIEENKKLVKELEKTKSKDGQELANMKAYTKTLDFAVEDSKTQKWLGGGTAFMGSASLFGSLIYSLLSLPGLTIMGIFSIGNIFKHSSDLKRTNNIELKKLDNIKSTYGQNGKVLFINRINKKKSFFKKIIPAWSSFGIGTSIILASTIAGLVGVTFPFSFMAGAAVLLLGGVATIIYQNVKNLKKVTPKNENRINRQFLGNEENILWKITENKKHLDLLANYKKELNHNFNKDMPSKRRKILLKNIGNVALNMATLGIPKFVKKISGKIEDEYINYMQSPILKEKTKNATLKYFSSALDEQIKYFEFLKRNIGLMDESLVNHIVGNNEVDKLPIMLEEKIINKKQLKDSIDMQINSKDDVKYFGVILDYMKNNSLTGTVFNNISTYLKDKNMMSKFEEQGYLIIEENKTNCSLNVDKLMDDLKKDNNNAKELLDIIYQRLYKTLVKDLFEEHNYQDDELSDHLEERIRIKK